MTNYTMIGHILYSVNEAGKNEEVLGSKLPPLNIENDGIMDIISAGIYLLGCHEFNPIIKLRMKNTHYLVE